MSVFDKKTYVICPRRHDFIRWCQDHNVDQYDKAYIHIYSPMQLMGRRIIPQDDIDYFNILSFHDGVYDEILKQLKIRSTGHEFP